MDPDVATDWSWLTTNDDLAEYERLVTTDMPDAGYPPVEKLRERLRANKRLILGDYEISKGRRHLAACFVVYPLLDEPLEYFFDGTYKNAQPITRRDLANNWANAKGTYVALLVGTTPRSKARIKEDLQRFIEFQEDIPVLARPVTADGFRTVRRFRMEPVGGTSEVWQLAARAKASADVSSDESHNPAS